MSMPRIVKEDAPEVLELAVDLLLSGELVAYPTDTLYGLGAMATDDAAVRRVFSAKGRPPTQALPLLVSDGIMASNVVDISALGHQLISAFWPGSLTIVMRRSERFHSLALAGNDTVAVRAPGNRLLRDIIASVGQTITGTSANRSGSRPPASAAEIAFQMGDMVALVIDGGRPPGTESTIIDITGSAPSLLREGAIGRSDIELVAGALAD
jgi:L-threonylcarbamoyladenylate synthase